ncbi:MAG: cell division protein ZapD [Methylococcaceae bacterium]|nr:cell division protein ZapD [Methylococcaceae bacterium]
MDTQTTYEFPLNERIRVFMRLEQLFIQLKHFLAGSTTSDKRAVMAILFDVSMIFSRNNIKSELLKESERLSNVLNKIANNPEVDRTKLDEMLHQLSESKERLHQRDGKIGAELINSYLFQNFSQRGSIPGGTCSFDLPIFHYWLSQDEEKQARELEAWTKPFLDIHDSVSLVLNLIRQSGVSRQEVAKAGFFQLTLDSSEVCQLLRVQVLQKNPCYAEISGGRHRFTVRFMRAALQGERPAQMSTDIAFSLSCCHL